MSLVEKKGGWRHDTGGYELLLSVPERPYTQTKIVDPGNDDRTALIYERAVDLGADAVSGVPLRRHAHVMGT